MTGTERFAFDRLVKQVDKLRGENKICEDVFVQLGSCTHEPRHCEWERFLDFSAMRAKVDEATLVVAHAGAGTTLLCLQRGKRPILVPRRKQYGEHVDEHQVPFARMMSDAGAVELVFEVEDLEQAIKEPTTELGATKEAGSGTDDAALADYLDALLDEWRESSDKKGVA